MQNSGALGLYLKGLMNIGYTETDLTAWRDDVREIEKKLHGSLSDEEAVALSEFNGKIER